jgi:hypothetical protein
LSETKKKQDIPSRLNSIVSSYRKAREIVDRSKKELNETSREVNEVLVKYDQLYKFYSQISTMPGGSFLNLQKATLNALLLSGADNATMAVGTARQIEQSVPHFSAVVSSGNTTVISIVEITRSIAERSQDFKRLVADWNLPLPRENQAALNRKLHEIAPRLENKLDGAWETFYDRTKVDRFRQASSSMRELISDTLQVLAPDLRIQEASWFSKKDPHRRPTQTDRARYAIVGKNAAVDEKDLKSVADLAKSIRESYEELNKYTHERGNQVEVKPEDLENQLVSLFNQTQIYLLEILRMRERFFKE